jgi:hypothetical protein
MTTRERTVGRYLRWFLAALALGAGVIHFAYSGDHYEMSWRHGTFFAVVAWLQLSYAVAVVLRPTRQLLIAGVVLNAAIMVVWAVSRVWGVPVGPDAWTPEDIGWADALSTVFEGIIVAVSLAVLVRPAIARAQVRPTFGVPAVAVPVLGVAVMSSLALSPALASGHSHAGGGEDMAGGHSHAALATDGKKVAKGHAGGHTNVVVQADGTSRCEQAGYANEGNSGHGHRGPIPYKELTAEERPLFRDQVALANEVIVKYSTVAAAEAAGWRRITPYVPCIAAHYLKSSALANPFDPAEPEILLFEDTKPESKIVGLSYLQLSPKEPEGFAGPNDPWHIHESLCIGGGGVVGDESTTDAECEARGGRNLNLGNLWMNHMWNVPGWDSRWGLFSSEHPDMGGLIGNINATPAEVKAAKAKAKAEQNES